MRTIHSANQLSICGAVSSWCLDFSGRMQGQESTGVNMSISEENEKRSQQLDPQEVGSLARSSPSTEGAAVNCWREHFNRFEMMTPEEQLLTVSERAGLVRTVSKGMHCKTWWGCGRWIWESYCVMPRVHFITDPTRFWSKTLDFQVHRDWSCSWCPRFLSSQRSGIEIQILSTAGDNTKVWVVISRSRNRYVDELRHRESYKIHEHVVEECVQGQDEEHSQGERSEARQNFGWCRDRPRRAKRWLCCIRGIHRARIVSLANDCCKSDGCCCEITRMRWTSRRRSISLHPGKNGEIQGCFKFQSLNVQIHGYVFHDTGGPNLGQASQAQRFFLNEICTVTRLLASCGETLWGGSIGIGMGKYRIANAYLFIENKDCSYRYTWMTSKWLEEQSMAPMWKKLMELVDLDVPTSCLDHAYLGCTQRECKPNEDIVSQHKEMFESRISATATEKIPGWEKLHAKTVAWSHDMEGHSKNCAERYCELANKKTEQLHTDSPLCLDDHNFKKEELETVGDLSVVCSQVVLKCLYLVRIGRPDILWSVSKLALAVTRWTRACDRRLARLISDIHHTNITDNIVMWVIQFKIADWVFSKTLIFAGDFEDSKSTSGWILCMFGSRTCVPISWMCKKQTSVYHSSTGSEITSLDAGLRMDGIPALDLWDVVIEVLHSSNNVPPTQKISTPKSKPRRAAGNCVRDNVHNIRLKKECDRNVHQSSDLDFCHHKRTFSQGKAQLYIFEDNDAVIKMIIKGRSPMMRHASRTHRAALDWLIDTNKGP